MQPYVLSAEQLAAIRAAEARVGSQNCWNDDELEALRHSMKRHYIEQQRRRCAYCNKTYPTGHLRAWDLDHIIPKDTHPQFTFEPLNLVASCIECNGWKSTRPTINGRAIRFPRASARFLIVNKHLDAYREHIIASGMYFYQGRSDKGAYTIWVCRLNRFLEQHLNVDFDIVNDDFYDLVGRLFEGDWDARILAGEMLLAFLRAKREEERLAPLA